MSIGAVLFAGGKSIFDSWFTNSLGMAGVSMWSIAIVSLIICLDLVDLLSNISFNLAT